MSTSPGNTGLLEPLARLNDLPASRRDIGPAMSADFGFVAHSAKRNPHKLSIGRTGDGFGNRGFPDAGRPDQTENGAFILLDQSLNGQVLNNAFLDFFQPEMVLVKDIFGFLQCVFIFRHFRPGHIQKPVNIIADNRGFRRHGRHHLELFDFLAYFLCCLFGEFLLFQAFFQFRDFIFEIVLFTISFWMARNRSFRPIPLSRFFPSAFDAPFDFSSTYTLFLKASGNKCFQPFPDIVNFNNFLFIFQLYIQMRDHYISEAGWIFDGGNRSLFHMHFLLSFR